MRAEWPVARASKWMRSCAPESSFSPANLPRVQRPGFAIERADQRQLDTEERGVVENRTGCWRKWVRMIVSACRG